LIWDIKGGHDIMILGTVPKILFRLKKLSHNKGPDQNQPAYLYGFPH
jgi:hypothetical protein